MLQSGESPRTGGRDEEHIARLAELDGPLPPILVERHTMRVIDGTHRLLAAVSKGQPAIEVEFFDGSSADAFLKAVEANVTHGLPLSLADRRAAAERIVTSHPHLSDRAIARTAGLGAKAVAAIRRRVAETADAPQVQASVAQHVQLTRSDPATVLEELLRDPSLRHNEEGRQLLDLLQQNAMGPEQWSELTEVVPEGCGAMVVDLARRCAEIWLEVAQRLDERVRAADQAETGLTE